jgi:LmbE family N-acetylglucosaminyl deacetylase
MADQLTRLLGAIRENGSPVAVVSPHLDDAVLSCGALLARLARCCPVTVLSVFTAAAPAPRWSWPARRLVRAAGVDAECLFERRRAEDRAVLAGIGVTAVHLGLRDALFRRSGEAAAGPPGRGRWPVYPTFHFDVARGRIAAADAGLAAEAAGRIREAARASQATVVFAPLGIGRHVDHLITRRAVQGLEPEIVYYSDFPYSESAAPDPAFVGRARLVPHPWLRGRAANASRIAGYRTEFRRLFPDGTVPTRPEIYWIPAAAATPAAATPAAATPARE